MFDAERPALIGETSDRAEHALAQHGDLLTLSRRRRGHGTDDPQQLVRRRVGDTREESQAVALQIVRARHDQACTCRGREPAHAEGCVAHRELNGLRINDLGEAGFRESLSDPVARKMSDGFEGAIARLVLERRDGDTSLDEPDRRRRLRGTTHAHYCRRTGEHHYPGEHARDDSRTASRTARRRRSIAGRREAIEHVHDLIRGSPRHGRWDRGRSGQRLGE